MIYFIGTDTVDFKAFAAIETVSMRFVNRLVDAVMDRFGSDVLMMKADEEHFDVTVSVSVSPQFFGWVFGLGKMAEVIGPEDVRLKMKEFLAEVSSKYT